MAFGASEGASTRSISITCAVSGKGDVHHGAPAARACRPRRARMGAVAPLDAARLAGRGGRLGRRCRTLVDALLQRGARRAAGAGGRHRGRPDNLRHTTANGHLGPVATVVLGHSPTVHIDLHVRVHSGATGTVHTGESPT